MQLPMCPKAVHDLSEKILDRIDLRVLSILLQLFYLASYDNQNQLGKLEDAQMKLPMCPKAVHDLSEKNS